MGVPSYFNWIITKYSKDNIITNNPTFKIKSLFFDLNCAIHPAVKENPNYTLEEMYNAVINYINEIINFVKPTDLVYLAIDGVAPRAKMEQQRSRRYKSILLKKMTNKINNKYKNKNNENINIKKENDFDFNMISPATNFMNELNIKIRNEFINKNKKSFKIILSDSNEEGEGEHKIFKYIRENNTTNIAVYGLDADLIFLSLINYKNNMVLIREKQHMINDKKNINNELNKYIYLDINLLYKKILIELYNKNIKNIENMENIENIENINKKYIIDYVFLSFFLGNDFLPNIPSLYIKEGGIEVLLNIYKNINTKLNDFLIINENNNYEINLLFFELLLQELSNCENDLLKKWSINKSIRVNKMLEKFKYLKPYERELEELNYIEWKEKDIIKFDEFGWKERYNYYYFKINILNKNKINKITKEYLQGMKWVLLYYLGLNNNWTWFYPYNVAPAISDFKVQKFNINFEKTNSVHPYIQLLYILPYESINNTILPKKLDSIINLIKKQDINLHLYYPLKFKIDIMNKKYFHDSILYLPEINIDYLQYLFKEVI